MPREKPRFGTAAESKEKGETWPFIGTPRIYMKREMCRAAPYGMTSCIVYDAREAYNCALERRGVVNMNNIR